MSADANGLQINIMGREFRVACPEEEQRGLLEAVDYLNRKMYEIRDSGKVIGLERIAIMAEQSAADAVPSTTDAGRRNCCSRSAASPRAAFARADFGTAFTATLSLASFHYLVQRTWIGVFLHGRRLELPWPWKAGRART